ncbi:MAG: YdaS family helix-turn-helix protein [Polaromonas sp.]
MNPKTGIQKAVSLFEDSPTKLATAVGNGVLRQHIEHWLISGRVPAERCPEVSHVTGIALEDLNNKVNWALVRGEATINTVG